MLNWFHQVHFYTNTVTAWKAEHKRNCGKEAKAPVATIALPLQSAAKENQQECVPSKVNYFISIKDAESGSWFSGVQWITRACLSSCQPWLACGSLACNE